MLIKTSKTERRHRREANRIANKVRNRHNRSKRYKGMVPESAAATTSKMLQNEPSKLPEWQEYERNL